MKILVACNKFPYPPRDGGSLATYNMIRGLAGAGNRVDLLAMNTSKHYSTDGASSIDIEGLNTVRDIYVDNSVKIPGLLYNFLFSPLPYNATRFFNREFRSALGEMLRKEEYDIVQFEGLYLAPYVEVIRENSDAIIAYRAHNIEYLIWESYCKIAENLWRKLYLGRLKEKIRKYEQEFVNKYDLLVTITGEDLRELDLLGNEKPAIVSPFGMYPDEFPLTADPEDDDPCLQYIGALDWMPNIDSLNWFIDRVWVSIKGKHPGLRFKVAGRNAGRGLVNKMAGKGIEFYGEVENSRDFLSQNGIFIVPLFSGSGIRVKIIEALFMKKAIISTSFAVSGIPVESGKNILIANNETEFIDHIDRLLEDRVLSSNLQMRAGELSAACFNNRLIADELSGFYKKFIL